MHMQVGIMQDACHPCKRTYAGCHAVRAVTECIITPSVARTQNAPLPADRERYRERCRKGNTAAASCIIPASRLPGRTNARTCTTSGDGPYDTTRIIAVGRGEGVESTLRSRRRVANQATIAQQQQLQEKHVARLVLHAKQKLLEVGRGEDE